MSALAIYLELIIQNMALLHAGAFCRFQEEDASDAGVPCVTSFRRRGAQTFAEAFE